MLMANGYHSLTCSLLSDTVILIIVILIIPSQGSAHSSKLLYSPTRSLTLLPWPMVKRSSEALSIWLMWGPRREDWNVRSACCRVRIVRLVRESSTATDHILQTSRPVDCWCVLALAGRRGKYDDACLPSGLAGLGRVQVYAHSWQDRGQGRERRTPRGK